MTNARTIPGLWRQAVAAGRPYPAFLVQAGGVWSPVSWTEADEAVGELAAGFRSLGLGRGDRVALLSRTRLEWTLCDYALASLGAVSVPVYPTSSALEVAYILGSSGARAVICEDSDQYAKVAPLRAELEALDHVVSIDGTPGSAIGLGDLRAKGRALPAAGGPVAGGEVGEDDPLTIIYTSGTTGPPKGCSITHRQYVAMVEMVRRAPGLFSGADRVLLYLPLAHSFARLCQYAGAGAGFTIAFCPDVALVADALGSVQPTIFPSVPRPFEKIAAALKETLEAAPGARGRIARWSLAVGREVSRRRQAGRRLPPGLAVRHALADRLVLRKVRARLGGRLRLAISGGAPLSRDVAELLHAVGVLVLEGYGLTECTTASHLNLPGRFRFGTVGLPLPGVEARIAPDGEVLLRGENLFAGYWGDERATRGAFTEDGWLKTGDVGSIDGDGFLTITDRKKDLIVTAGGKNVSPQNIENALKATGHVEQALVVGDRRPYLVALLAPSRDLLERARQSPHEVRAIVEQDVAAVNRQLGRTEQIRRFAILGRELEAERGELTPTLKVRRRVCEQHFRAEIEQLYAVEEDPA